MMTNGAAEHGDGINRSREDVGDIKHRKGVSALSADELAASTGCRNGLMVSKEQAQEGLLNTL